MPALSSEHAGDDMSILQLGIYAVGPSRDSIPSGRFFLVWPRKDTEIDDVFTLEDPWPPGIPLQPTICQRQAAASADEFDRSQVEVGRRRKLASHITRLSNGLSASDITRFNQPPNQ